VSNFIVYRGLRVERSFGQWVVLEEGETLFAVRDCPEAGDMLVDALAALTRVRVGRAPPDPRAP
jgi:hypothetical protein